MNTANAVPYVYQATCGTPGFLETFGSGVGRSAFSASASSTYIYDNGTVDTPPFVGPIGNISDGEYATLDKSSIAGAGSWWIVDDDHTGDADGHMLMVNSDFASGEFYRQSISGLEIGKTYSFAAYLANAYSAGDGIDPNVKFSLESGGVEITSVTTGNIPEDPGQDELAWTKYDLVFTATQANLDIVLSNFSLGGGGNDIVIDDISLSEACLSPNQCYALNGDNTSLYKFDLDLLTAPISVNMPNIINGEGAAYRATNNALYAFNQAVATSGAPSDLYEINITDGTNTLIATSFIPSRSSGAEFVKYTDGTEQFIVLMDESDSYIQTFDATDLASKTPLKTLHLTNPDGTNTQHLDGLAVNPNTGEVLVMKSYEPDFTNPAIYSVDMNNGLLTHKVTLSSPIDAESFTFSVDGNAYTESERNGTHEIFRINLATGALTQVEDASLIGDIEALACTGSQISSPPPPLRCLNSPFAQSNGLKVGVPNSPWPSDPSITYTLTATNFQTILTGRNTYGTPDGLIKGAAGTADAPQKQVSALPVTLNITLSQPVPANQFYYTTQDIENPMGDDNASTINVISGTATPADFSHGSWNNVKAPGVYNPITGKVTMTNMGDNSTGDAGMFWMRGETLATVQELEISTGSFLAAGDYVSFTFTNVGCPLPGISGTVFQDDNTNNVFDSGESGLPTITVTLYSDVNNDGAVDAGDTIADTVSSIADGSYSFTNVVDGNYLVQVDDTDTDLPASASIGGTNPLAVTLNGLDITDQNFPFDVSSCDALAGSINNGLSPNKKLKNNEKLFLATTTLTPDIEGHLNAYTINSEGAIATPDSSLWDAASQMTSLERASRLWSTDSNGSKILFNELDAAAFASNGIPDVASIKSFTLNPSHDYPVYIGERRRDSFLGAISPNSNLVLIDHHVNPMEYLRESAYRTFYNNTVSARTKRILLTSDDGFLYAFNQSDGDLGWGWMPRTLAKALKEHSSFPNEHLMQGHLKKMDLKTSGQYASYIVGSYQQGLGQYVLKLDSNNNLDSVIWDIDHKALNALSDYSPNQGEGAYFHDTNGKKYIAYVITDIGGSSKLYIKSLTDTTLSYEVLLDFTATSTPFVMYDYGKNNSPAPSTLYLGDNLGNVHSATLLITGNTDTGTLKTREAIQTDMNDGAIASLDTTDSSPVLYLGASTSSSAKRGFYLRAQSEDRLTVFKYDAENTAWIKHWTAFVDGAGKWDADSFATDTEIQRLPSGSKISANATIVANSIVLPVTHAPAGNACYGTAHYYLYSLTDGHLPVRRFYNASNDTEITSIINLGYGDAKQLHLSPLLGSDKIMGLGIATQKPDNTTGISASLFIHDPVTTGVRGWKELH